VVQVPYISSSLSASARLEAAACGGLLAVRCVIMEKSQVLSASDAGAEALAFADGGARFDMLWELRPFHLHFMMVLAKNRGVSRS
jgi:hypothetical protein